MRWARSGTWRIPRRRPRQSTRDAARPRSLPSPSCSARCEHCRRCFKASPAMLQGIGKIAGVSIVRVHQADRPQAENPRGPERQNAPNVSSASLVDHGGRRRLGHPVHRRCRRLSARRLRRRSRVREPWSAPSRTRSTPSRGSLEQIVGGHAVFVAPDREHLAAAKAADPSAVGAGQGVGVGRLESARISTRPTTQGSFASWSGARFHPVTNGSSPGVGGGSPDARGFSARGSSSGIGRRSPFDRGLVTRRQVRIRGSTRRRGASG